MIELTKMFRLRSRKRVQSHEFKVLSSRRSSALLMAGSLSSIVLNMITKLSVPKAPTTSFAGVALNDDEATQLIRTCTGLRIALNLQLDVIGKIPSTSNEHVVSRIRQIQIHHTNVQIHLSTIISKTKRSTTLWVREFGDGHAALERKIMTINRRSRGLGCLEVARQCWPEVAVTYWWLLALVSRLQDELRQALKRRESCTTSDSNNAIGAVEEVDDENKQKRVALYTTHRHVHFGQEAIVREYQIRSSIGEQGFEKQSVAVLSDDSEMIVGRFRAKKPRPEI